ncbi:MAG: hypothetical protein HZB87_00465 [Desulfatitalea sp.]|nr:hypothetical protein [Desulfatitalea sp.]
MIEFKGLYRPSAQNEAVGVLVQYDGLLLHVWHLSEPFHRLVTSEQFDIVLSFTKTHRTIKLANGGRIETSDREAVRQLAQSSKTFPGSHFTFAEVTHWLIALLGISVLFFGAWCLAAGKLTF